MGENSRDGLVATQEDLAVVLIHGTLRVADGRDVLDDDDVVGVFAGLVEDGVGLDHVVDDVALGDLLGAELALRAQVLAVVVAEMVVRGNRGQLDASVDEEVNQGRLHLGLAGLEVVAANEGAVALGQLDAAGHEGVLRRAVDERDALQDGGDGKDGRGRDLLVAVLDGVQEVVSGVVDALNDAGIALSVGGPQNNDLVETVGGLEVADVLADLLNVLPAGLVAREDVVGTVFLVGSNEVRVVDARQGLHGGHLLADKGLQGRLQDLGAIHGISQVQAGDIPTANDDIVGVDHGQDAVEGDVDVLVGLGVGAKLDRRAHDDGAVVVGLLLAVAGLPDEAAAVGNDTGRDGRAVVAAPTDEHDTELGQLAVDLEVIDRLARSGNQRAVLGGGDLSGAVDVLGANFVIRVHDIRRVHLENGGNSGRSDRRGRNGGGDAVAVGLSTTVRKARVDLSVRRHFGCLVGERRKGI